MNVSFDKIESLYELLDFSSKKFPNRIALSEYKNSTLNTLTYLELEASIAKKSNELGHLGFKKGSNIALSGFNSIDWVISFFSIMKIGCTAVPIDPKMNNQGIDFILKYTQAKLFLVDKLKNFESLSMHQNIIKTMDNTTIKIESEKNNELESLVLLKNIDNSTNDVENSIAEILFTSGTTGEPKGVLLTHKNLISNIKDIHNILPSEEYEKSFSILPLHHVYELTCSLLHGLSKGNCIHFCSKIDLPTMVKEMKEIQPTIWPVVPLILEKIYKNINKKISQSIFKRILMNVAPKLFGIALRNKLGLKSLKLLLSGGAALSPSIEKFFNRIGMPVTQGYGLSEASPLVSVNILGQEKIGSVGKVIDSCRIKIINANSLGHGTILVKGPNVFLGYYKNKEATDDVLQDGWLNTGDIGYVDEEGFLYITGRDKFVIVNKGGKNIYPEEIEEFFSSSTHVKDIVVFSKDDENIIAIILPDDELISRDINEIKKIINEECQRINKKLEAYKRVNKFYITLEEFEKTSTQKIKRSFLKNINLRDYILTR